MGTVQAKENKLSLRKPIGHAPTTASHEEPFTASRKKLVRRVTGDYSQRLRLAVQIFFLVLNAWIGVQFYLWVRWAEGSGQGRGISHPAGIAGWLPIDGLMQLKYFLLTGSLPLVHPAALFLISAFLLISFLFRKSFCSWLCPIGTIAEFLWKIGHFLFRRNFRVPRWLDIPLRGLKYVLLSLFVFAIATMSAASIAEFLASPYAIVVDVRMLNFFCYLSGTAAFVLAVLVVLSLLIQNFWCRYLCPYGALMGMVSLLSPVRIARFESACIDCAKCAKACPSSLPVHKLIQIRSAECTGCLECVAVCPAQGALDLSIRGPLPKMRRPIPSWTLAAGIAIIFFGLVGYATLSGHWETRLPDDVYFRLVPAADEFQH